MRKSILSLIMMVGLLFAEVHDVTPQKQLQSNWCWAACMQMVLSYLGIEVEQCELLESGREKYSVWSINTNDCIAEPDKCNFFNTMTGFSNSVQGLYKADYKIATKAYTRSLSKSEIEAALSKGYLIHMGWTWKGGGGGHQLLLVGLVEKTAYYLDPWEGELFTMPLAELKESDNHTWGRSLIVEEKGSVPIEKIVSDQQKNIYLSLKNRTLHLSEMLIGKNLEVRNMQGRIVSQTKIAGTMLPLRDIAVGAYLLSVFDVNGKRMFVEPHVVW